MSRLFNGSLDIIEERKLISKAGIYMNYRGKKSVSLIDNSI